MKALNFFSCLGGIVFALISGSGVSQSDLSGIDIPVPLEQRNGGSYIAPIKFPGPDGQAQVIDGDTIKIDQTNIRLLGVDVPAKDTEAGKHSKMALRAIIGEHDVKCEDTGKTSGKRMVAQCYIHYRKGKSELDIGEELIRRGWAYEIPSDISGATAKEYAAAELFAVENGKGKWERPTAILDWLSPIITAIGTLATVIFAVSAAKKGAQTGAETQADLAAKAARERLRLKRDNLKAHFAQEIKACLLLVHDRTRLIFGNIGGAGVDEVKFVATSFDRTLLRFTAKTCQRMMGEVHILDEEHQFAISKALHALMKLSGDVEKSSPFSSLPPDVSPESLFDLLTSYKILVQEDVFTPSLFTSLVTNLYAYLQYREERDMRNRVTYLYQRTQLITGFAPSGGWGNKVMVPIWPYKVDKNGIPLFSLSKIDDADLEPFDPNPRVTHRLFYL